MSSAVWLPRFLDNLRQSLPDLAIASVRPILGNGQNNAVFIVNESIVFRFPLYVPGIAGLERELTILRKIRPHLTVAIPEPRFVSLGDPTIGRAFLGYPMIPGVPLWQETLDSIADDRILGSLGRQIGEFLKELHAIPIESVLPGETLHHDPLAAWRDLFQRIRDRLYGYMRPEARVATTKLFETFFREAAGWQMSPVLIHGDFGTSNILVDPDIWKITGVIDFTSAGAGDPAIDFAALPGAPRAFHEGVIDAYPDVARAADRIRFYRGTFALQEALFGVESGDDAAFRAGIVSYR